MKGNALDRVEEAVGLLRELHSDEWLAYALGAVPLNIALLLLVRDIAAGYGEDLCLRDSFLCAAAFLWASFWKARFAGAMLNRLSEMPEAVSNPVWKCAFVQCMLQSLKLLLFPLAAISVVPMPWFSTLFRNVSIEANRSGATILRSLKAASEKAALERNWIPFLICTVAAIVVFLNVFVAVLALPNLLETFTGHSNEWTRGYSAVRNFNLFSIAVAITWFVIDPLLQACAAVGSFYFEARKDGRDLLVGLRRIVPATLLCCLLLASSRDLWADGRKPVLTSDEVRREVRQLTADREFAWLHTAAPKTGSRDRFSDRILRDCRRASDAIGSFFDKAGDWWNKLFGKRSGKPVAHNGKEQANGRQLQWYFYVGATLCIVVAVVLLLQHRSRQGPAITGDTGVAPALISVDDALATERQQNEWLAIARDFAAKGDLRSAIRAMYLANLSHLGAVELLRITKSKSNAIYERELKNRCRTDAVSVAFARSNRAYEEVWFGMHDVTPELRENFEQCVSVIQAHA